MKEHSYKNELASLRKFYADLLEKYGNSAQAVQHKDRVSQERRMEILVEVGELRSAKILDFGCGTGHLLNFMQKENDFVGEYVGYDISPEMIATAQQVFSLGRFEQRDVLAEGIPEKFDYVLVNGTFNNRLEENWGLMTSLLKALFPHTRIALAFNVLSTYVDFLNPGNFYVSPSQIFKFCKEELSPCVTLRHDYQTKPGIVPFEFTVYVYQTEIEPRKELHV